MKKILVIVPHLKQGGGLTEFVLHVYSELVKNYNYQVEVIAEAKLSGVKVPEFPKSIKITIAPRISDIQKYMRFWKKVAESTNQYNYVHFHTDSLTKFYPYLLMRKKNNIIVHSHNATNDRITSNLVKAALHNFGRAIIHRGNFRRFACSDLAARWLFNRDDYYQVNNAIDLKKFKFNLEERKNVKERFNIEGKIVYGHIGRFLPVKNQTRVVQIFKQVYEIDSNSILFLFGDGADRRKVEKLVKSLGLEDVVYFMGYRADINLYLNALDFIIFPSFYEGLPITLIEAQANGVNVFFSDTITSKVKLLDTSQPFSLKSDNLEIASEIRKIQLNTKSRFSSVTKLQKRGYDLSDLVNDLNLYYSVNDHQGWKSKTIYYSKDNG